MIFELIAAVAFAAGSHAKNCAANEGAAGDMLCVERNGQCVSVAVDGHETSALKDPATIARVESIKHGQDVCFVVSEPVSSKFRVKAKGGGRRASFIGPIEKLGINLYALGDYDPKFDSSLESLNGIELKADGGLDGTWQLKSERPLKPGEYLAVIRVFGQGNWDKQAVLLKLDAALAPAPAEK
jgi:hypothetical protein